MNNFIHKIEKWGRAARHLPRRADELKTATLAHLEAPSGDIPRVIPTRRLPWLSLAFAVLAIIAFVTPNFRGRWSPVTSVPMLEPLGSTRRGNVAFESRDDLSMGSSRTMPRETIYPQPHPSEPPATDTREYLKTDYHAAIRTRHVQDVGNRATAIIRGYDGRIDSSSLSKSSGYLSFVLPATKLDAFRTELTNIAGTRFITEQTATRNLLPEKRGIESEQETAQQMLTRLERGRANLIASFRRTEADLNTRIAAATTDDERRTLQDELARARRTYESRKQNLNVQIQSTRDRLASLDDQTSDLLDTVATVRGSVSLQHISPYDVVNAYLHGYTIALALLLLALGTYAYHHRRASLVI